MPSIWKVVACFLVLTAFWTLLGIPISRRLYPQRWLALPLAPSVGWAIHTGLALPICLLFGATTPVIVGFTAILMGCSLFMLLRDRSDRRFFEGGRIPIWIYVGAVLLALVPLLAVVPKISAHGVALSVPMFDHSKIALVDEMALHGVPPTNPFFAGAGVSPRLAYYYAWHFSAAEIARVFGVGGWAADAALTGFTALSSLALMMGIAAWHAGRPIAAIYVLPLAVVGSARPLLDSLFGAPAVDHVLSTYPSLAGWLVQASWVPQHLAAAVCVVLATLLACQLGRDRDRYVVPALAVLIAAAFGCSTYVGGIVLALAAPGVGAILLAVSPPGRRRRVVVGAALGVVGSLVLASPFLHDEFVATAARGVGAPIAVHPYEVIGPFVRDPERRWLDVPAFWLVLLPLTLPAAVPLGLAALIRGVRRASDHRETVIVLGLLAFASFATSWLLISTIGNNDLGWRAILPGILVLTAFAASVFSTWREPRLRAGVAFAACVAALGLPGGYAMFRDDVYPAPTRASERFAETPALWGAVRSIATPADRVGNNPLMLQAMLPWPVDISWALLARQRSCFAGWELTRAYAALPLKTVTNIDTQFIRVFDGKGSAEDVRDLATRYGCTLIVLTPQDGAWSRDPFAASPFYALIQQESRWRIYRRSPKPESTASSN